MITNRKDVPYEYSDNEWKLIEYFKLEDLVKSPSMVPSLVYTQMAIKAVSDCDFGEETKAVSRALNNMNNTFRLTPEFEKLITVG